jgi:hypothetical protein
VTRRGVACAHGVHKRNATGPPREALRTGSHKRQRHQGVVQRRIGATGNWPSAEEGYGVCMLTGTARCSGIHTDS